MLVEITKILIRKGYHPTYVGIPERLLKNKFSNNTYGVCVKFEKITEYCQVWSQDQEFISPELIANKLIEQVQMDEALQ